MSYHADNSLERYKNQDSTKGGAIIENLTAELKRVDRTLEDKISFYRRICLSRYVWISFFEEPYRQQALKDWDSLLSYTKAQDGAIFTHQIAEMLSTGVSPFLTLHQYMDRLEEVANYIVYGNSPLEETISDSVKDKAHQKAVSIVSNHIINNM